jgi:taurine dioxygenase
MNPEPTKTDYDQFTVRPFTPLFGAEIFGLNISKLDNETTKRIHEAWMDWKVLVFRDQDITSDEQLAFALHFGEVDHSPYLDIGKSENVSVLDNPVAPRFSRADDPRFDEYAKLNEGLFGRWHTDATFRDCPPYSSFLIARILPSVGGDTLWADMEQAYEGLGGEVKLLIDGRTATHSVECSSFVLGMSHEEVEEELKRFPPQHHPMVRTHPVTGRKSLYVNSVFVDQIDGLSEDQGQRLYRDLLCEVHRPEYQMRLRWEIGSLVMWDNRCVQHYPVYDYYERRRMERVTLAGEKPV